MSRFPSPRAAVPVVALLLAALPSARASGQRVFFGNLHSHTSYSDGSGTPEEAFRHARDQARLDFLAVTEHNHRSAEQGARDERRDGILIATRPELYNSGRPEALVSAANRLTQDGRFVAIYGQEFSSISSGNHVNVFDVDSVITARNGRFDLLVEWLARHPASGGRPAVVQFNHPELFDDDAREYGADDFGSRAEWIAEVGRFASLIEILNGPAMAREGGHRAAEEMERDYLHYLNLGFHLAPTADQDNHFRTWGTATDARTAVVADQLTRAQVLDALRARHVYATEDRNLELIFRVNGALMGDVVRTLPAAGSPLRIAYTLRDRDEPDAGYVIEVFSDDGPGGDPAERVDAFEVEGNTPPGQTWTIPDVPFRRAGQYLFFKVRQVGEDGEEDRAWTAPVWFEPAGFGPPAAAGVRMVSLLPNAPGDEQQNEEVTVRNLGSAPVDVRGWKLRDADGRTWSLDALGTLAPGATRTVRRNGQRMSLNNGGDTITLLDAGGTPVQSVSYPQLPEGQRFTVPD